MKAAAAVLPLLAVVALAACATNRPSESERLALYQAHAGEPVDKIRNFNPMGWDRIDDQHVLLDMRPNESWLLRVSGPCLDWGSASPVLQFSSTGAYVMAKFDRILTAGSVPARAWSSMPTATCGPSARTTGTRT